MKTFALVSTLLCQGGQLPAGASGQAPRIFKAVRSPEVHPDRRATFRFFAPNAKKVSLERDWGPRVDMTMDAKGVWSFTSEGLPPDIYTYSFVVDGVQLGDPGNPWLKPSVTGGVESLVRVPGTKALPWEERDGRHGAVHRHRYDSAAVGEAREFLVYTPPGYNPKVAYPVLFLLHGVMESEGAWTAAGRAHVILDNLIADRKAKPMIVVMPFGYGMANVPDRVGDIFSGRRDNQRDMDAVGKTIFEEITPEVERLYRTARGPKNRAIAGLSMGGAQALYLGLKEPHRFGAVGSFSGAFIMYGAKLDAWFPNPKTNAKIWIACGKEDFLINPNRQMRTWLTGKSVPFEWTETPGTHTWQVWRRNLAEFAPRLFR
ncbi:MAG: alpha/beta hydrolase-fold protein [Fimbriimonas sp.]